MKPDVVHTHMNDAFLYTTLSFLTLRNTAYVHTLHNMPVEEAVSKAGFRLRKYLFKKGKVVPVTIAPEALTQTRKVYGLNMIPLIYNGRALAPKTEQFAQVAGYIASLRETPDTKIILNVGRFSEQKNQILLIEQVKQMNREARKAKLLIIGSDQSPVVLAKMKEAADSNIIFLGKKSNVQDYLYASDIFSLPSLWEGMPISLIEAFSAGCVPVCTPAGGVASMIEDGATGFLAAGFEQEDLANAFRKYFDCTPDHIQAISKRGTDDFRRLYDIRKCTENYTALYASAASKN
jgi:glycosyltransferase involved in cell wall biosynthesis